MVLRRKHVKMNNSNVLRKSNTRIITSNPLKRNKVIYHNNQKVVYGGDLKSFLSSTGKFLKKAWNTAKPIVKKVAPVAIDTLSKMAVEQQKQKLRDGKISENDFRTTVNTAQFLNNTVQGLSGRPKTDFSKYLKSKNDRTNNLGDVLGSLEKRSGNGLRNLNLSKPRPSPNRRIGLREFANSDVPKRFRYRRKKTGNGLKSFGAGLHHF